MIRLSQSFSAPGHVQSFDVTDRGLLLADGVFDTSRVVDGAPLLWRDHVDRLVGDAAALGIDTDAQALTDLARSVVPDGAHGALRVTVTRGPSSARGLAGDSGGAPTVLARCTPLDIPFPAPPVRLGLSAIRRNPTSPTTRHKTLAYTDNVMALREAAAAGFDEALLLSVDGKVACASAANVFACFGRRLVTPVLADGAMPGIVRAWLKRFAPQAGYQVFEESLSLDQFGSADQIFLTNSLRILQPVSAFDGKAFATDIPDQLRDLGQALLDGRFHD